MCRPIFGPRGQVKRTRIVKMTPLWPNKTLVGMSNSQINGVKAAVCRQLVERVYFGIAAFLRGDPNYSTSDGYIIRPKEERWLIAHFNDGDIPHSELLIIIECFVQTSAVRAIDALIEFTIDKSNSKKLWRISAEAISLIDSEVHRSKLIELRNSSTGELRRLFDVALNPVGDEHNGALVQFNSFFRQCWNWIKGKLSRAENQ